MELLMSDEIYTAKPSSYEIKITTDKLKGYKLQGTNPILVELIQA
jgi:hypothetical protein